MTETKQTEITFTSQLACAEGDEVARGQVVQALVAERDDGAPLTPHEMGLLVGGGVQSLATSFRTESDPNGQRALEQLVQGFAVSFGPTVPNENATPPVRRQLGQAIVQTEPGAKRLCTITARDINTLSAAVDQQSVTLSMLRYAVDVFGLPNAAAWGTALAGVAERIASELPDKEALAKLGAAFHEHIGPKILAARAASARKAN